MKKFLAVILAMVYMVTATGMTVQLHYCMGKLADWSVFDSHSAKCDTCGMDKEPGGDNGCCKDELKVAKIDDQKASVNNIAIAKIAVESTKPVDLVPVLSLPAASQVTPQSHAPPRSCGTSLCILNSIFRI